MLHLSQLQHLDMERMFFSPKKKKQLSKAKIWRKAQEHERRLRQMEFKMIVSMYMCIHIRVTRKMSISSTSSLLVSHPICTHLKLTVHQLNIWTGENVNTTTVLLFVTSLFVKHKHMTESCKEEDNVRHIFKMSINTQ